MKNPFETCNSKYSIKKMLSHELSKVGMVRPGWDLESERSHFEGNGDYEVVDIYDMALERLKSL